jgi:hypothetical protein
MTGRATPYRAAEYDLEPWPTTRHTYSSRASMERGERRYRGRIESTGVSGGRDGTRWTLYVYDLDEYGYPPSFPCPCCGRYDDE